LYKVGFNYKMDLVVKDVNKAKLEKLLQLATIFNIASMDTHPITKIY
jgi:hypothetical protein